MIHMLFALETGMDASPISTSPKCRHKVTLHKFKPGTGIGQRSKKEHNQTSKQNIESYSQVVCFGGLQLYEVSIFSSLLYF